jgi:hypothetical protein
MDTTNDHDLLIELRTEMRGVRSDIQDLNSGVSKRLDDHEIRLRTNEGAVIKLATSVKTWGSVGLVALGSLEIVLRVFLK